MQKSIWQAMLLATGILQGFTHLDAALVHEPDGRIVVTTSTQEDHLYEVPCAGMGGEHKIYQIEATLNVGGTGSMGTIQMVVGRRDFPALTWLYTGGDALARVASGVLPTDSTPAPGSLKVLVRLYPTLTNTMRMDQSVTTAGGVTTSEIVMVPMTEFDLMSWATLKIHAAGDASIALSYRAFNQHTLFLVK